MPNWNRIIVGDAFKVQPAGLNYYRDLFLLWPFLGFSIVTTSILLGPRSAADRLYGLKSAACAAIVLILAKERRLLVLGATSYVALRMAVRIIFIHTWQVLEWLLISGGILVVVFLSGRFKDWKPSYAWPEELHVLDIVIGVLGLVTMIGIFQWIRP
jgi:hypothetical protein